MAQTAVRAVSCDTCGKKYRYKAELAGKKVKCPCGGRVRFPAEEAEETPRVDVALQELAQAEAAAPQDEQEEVPAAAPPISAKPARATPSAKSKLISSVKEKISSGSSGGEEKWKWWYFVGGGVFLLGFAVWKYITLSQAESTGDSGFGRISGNDRTLYMIFGKWGVVVGTVLAGLVALAIGLWQF